MVVYRCVKNSVLVKEEGPAHASVYWYADKYECPKCQSTIITGSGNGSVPSCMEVAERLEEQAEEFFYG